MVLHHVALLGCDSDYNYCFHYNKITSKRSTPPLLQQWLRYNEADDPMPNIVHKLRSPFDKEIMVHHISEEEAAFRLITNDNNNASLFNKL